MIIFAPLAQTFCFLKWASRWRDILSGQFLSFERSLDRVISAGLKQFCHVTALGTTVPRWAGNVVLE